MKKPRQPASKKTGDVPETLTFAQARDMLADDVRSIGGFLASAEKDCRDGDVSAVLNLIENMSIWRQMLMLRYEDRMQRVEAGRPVAQQAG